MSQDIEPLHRYGRDVGGVYGTEDFSIFLYSLIKMQRPSRILELGTGTGVSTFWMARALAENGNGSLLTIDDGSQWERTQRRPALKPYGGPEFAEHKDFIRAMAERFGVDRHLELITATIPPFPTFEPTLRLDLIFSDFRHDPPGILMLLRHFLPMMSEASSIFIDSASTMFPSYLLLERLVEHFNAGAMPREMLKGLSEDAAATLRNAVRGRRFTLVHLTETKDRDQNSTAWIKIEPIDVLPHPLTRMH